MRGRPELARWGAEALARRGRGLRRLRAHPRGARGRRRARRPRARRPAGRRPRTSSGPQPRAEALAALLDEARRDPPNPATPRSASPTRATPPASPRFFAVDEPTVLYFGKLIENKGVQVLLEALAGLDARAVVVGFGDYRAELEALAPRRDALHRPARAPSPRPPAAALRRLGRALDLPGGVRDGRRRGRVSNTYEYPRAGSAVLLALMPSNRLERDMLAESVCSSSSVVSSENLL